MSTPLAKFVEEPDYYDKNFRVVTFYFPRGYKYPELEQAVFSLRHEHLQNEAADKADRIGELWEKLESLIDRRRAADPIVDQKKNAHLEAVRHHGDAESTLSNRIAERSQFAWSIAHTVGNRKRSEIARDETQLARANELVAKAEIAESQAVNDLQYAVAEVEEARAARNAALQAELTCKAELDRLMGVKNDYSESRLAME